MKKFESWQEAYEYQLNSRTDETDPLFMYGYHLESGILEMDCLVATTEEGIVWMLVVEEGIEKYKQYGVGKNLSWYSVQFDGYNKPIERVPNSLKEYRYLPQLVKSDKDAKIIYQLMEELQDVFEFLVSGKIMPTDEIDLRFMENAERVVDYAKEQLAMMNEEEDVCCGLSEVCCPMEEDYCYEEVESWDDEEDDICLEEDEESYLYEEDDDFEDVEWDEWNDFDTVQEVQFEEVVAESKVEEKVYPYILRYGDIEDDDAEEYDFVGTESEANDKYNEVVGMGYGFVELLQVRRVSVAFN